MPNSIHKNKIEKSEPNNNQHIINKEITEELKESYLDYAMSVIVSRALPDVRDGLKPVQRRILFTMFEEGFRFSGKFRKSANVVGSTLGHYHPHGESAVYDSLVRMAQNFSLRYPLIQGQGNFGSIDGDPPAAMRYTECKLAPLAEEMLEDIDKDTVDFVSNYDNSRQEPLFLPAKVPQLIINGSMGIAVGMATNIPPHNLTEVCSALIYLIDHLSATTEDLMKYIPGPDFPTGGFIFGQEKLAEIYANGKGSFLCRGKAEIEEDKNTKIIISEIPYLVNKANLITQIAHLVEEKKIEGIKDLRDETNKEGLRIVIDLKNDAPAQRILGQLYKFTELEKTFYINMLALIENGLQPQILSLKDILVAYLNHRKIVVVRRTKYLLAKAAERAHILEGLVKAINHIDEIIQLIKKSDSRAEAQQKLIDKFGFDEIQANAILEIKLHNLARLERGKIEEELKEKQALIKHYELVLSNPKEVDKIIKEELTNLIKTYGDARRTVVIGQAPAAIKDEDLIPEGLALITFSQGGYIKRMASDLIRDQKRGGKGVISYEPKSQDDVITQIISCHNKDELLFFTDRGRLFRLRAFEILEASRTASGKSIQNYLSLQEKEKVISLIKTTPLGQGHNYQYLVLATQHGLIKKISLEEIKTNRKNGLLVIKLNNNDKVVGANLTTGSDEVLVATKKGQGIRFSEHDLRSSGRAASGVIGIKLTKGDEVISLITITKELRGANIISVTQKGFGKKTPLSQIRKQKRGGQGLKIAKVTEKTGVLINVCLLPKETEFLLAVSQEGQIIKLALDSIPVLNRLTQGVRVMKLNPQDELASISLL
jgi:DNA gyrase subunit A